MAPQTQKALVVTEVGKPLVLITDRPVPQPGPKQVQVQVTVFATNPHDQKARDRGLFIGGHLPALLANDVVGRVVAVGSNVTKYSVGDRIASHAGFDPTTFSQNGTQEYAVVDEDFSFKIPDAFTDDDAATLPTNIIAPLVALFNPANLDIPAPWTEAAASFDYKNTSILVVGGGSNCGKFGVQLAALAGIGQIIVVGGEEKELKSYGATTVIDRHGSSEEIIKAIQDLVGDDLVYAYDAVNPPDGQALAVNALSSTKKGRFARLLPLGPINDALIHQKKEGYEVTNVFGSSQAKPDVAKPFWERVPGYLTEKKIVPLPYTTVQGLTAENVNGVLDAYRDGKKIIQTHFHV